MNDYIDFSNVSKWFEGVLRRHHLLRYSQLTSHTERQLLGLGLGVGSVRHAYLLLEQEGLSFYDKHIIMQSNTIVALPKPLIA